MTEPLKIMVIDDSALYRVAITRVLQPDRSLDVVATAPNGKIALMKMRQAAPDVITLDMEMPEMDGLATLKELASQYPDIKTIVFSQHSTRGAKITLEALELGAVDFVTKPASSASLDSNIADIREALLPKMRELARQCGTAETDRLVPVTSCSKSRIRALPRDVIAIGVSTGGPSSLATLFRQLPKSMKQAILIVQHMPAIFTKQLAKQLARIGTIPVSEAVDGEPIRAGHAYVAPGNFHLEVALNGECKVLRTHQGRQENYCRPAVDVLFRSIAKVYKQRCIGVVMTGMGKDGLAGSKAMKSAGAAIVAQDKASSVVWGMPRLVIENNFADSVAPLDRMYESIKEFLL